MLFALITSVNMGCLSGSFTAMQTHYEAALEKLKVAVADLATEYQHYSSGVVRLEVMTIVLPYLAVAWCMPFVCMQVAHGLRKLVT